jgi:IS605 OrfB family transposase
MSMKTTIQLRLYPTSEQAALLRAHCREYISTINVLTHALDAGVLPDDGKGASTKDFTAADFTAADFTAADFTAADFTAALPSAVKNQALRDAHSVWKRSFELGHIPVLRKPICQWNNQNWRIESRAGGPALLIPVSQDGQVQQMAIRCAAVAQEGAPGLLRIKRKRGKWIAEIAYTLPTAEPTTEQGVMGVDLGVKLPAVIHVGGKGTRYLGNGRYQRMMRRRFYARRRQLQQAGKIRAVRKSQGKERRWMRDINHKLSRHIVNQAQAQGVGTIRLEQLAGIRMRTACARHAHGMRTARTSRGAKRSKARKNNRMIATWPFYQLSAFIAYKAERLGMRVEQVDLAYTSQTRPACFARNKAQDRCYVCSACGWTGHRDEVGAINISRRTGPHGHSAGAAVA